jgi:ParB-like chromosome segregation protein Spo0J
MFPMLGEDAIKALADDIAANGQKEPILVYGDQVIDGRNRLAACERVGVKPVVMEVGDAEVGDPFAYVLSLNYHRRHLTPAERGEIIRAEMKRRGGDPDKPGKPGPAPKSSGRSGPDSPAQPAPPTVADIAKALGVTKRKANKDLAAAAKKRGAPPRKPKQPRVKSEAEENDDCADVKRKAAQETRDARQFREWLEKTEAAFAKWAPMFFVRAWSDVKLTEFRSRLDNIAELLAAMQEKTCRVASV